MRNIVFDFGGVLMKHDKEGCLHDLRQLLPAILYEAGYVYSEEQEQFRPIGYDKD